MPVIVACSVCKKKLKAPDTARGKNVKCPCGQKVPVPEAEPNAEQDPEEPPPLPSKARASTRGSSDETLEQAKAVGAKSYAKAREATGNAWQALKIMFIDPMSGQAQALDALGPSRAFQAGIVFVIVFILAVFLLGDSLYIAPLRELARGMTRASIGEYHYVKPEIYLKMVVVCAVPAVALMLGFWLLGQALGGKASFQTSVFVTGVALLPLACAALLSRLAGMGNIELVVTVDIYVLCVTVLLFYASLVVIQKVSTRAGFLLTPVLVLGTAYIAKVIYFALFND